MPTEYEQGVINHEFDEALEEWHQDWYNDPAWGVISNSGQETESSVFISFIPSKNMAFLPGSGPRGGRYATFMMDSSSGRDSRSSEEDSSSSSSSSSSVEESFECDMCGADFRECVFYQCL